MTDFGQAFVSAIDTRKDEIAKSKGGRTNAKLPSELHSAVAETCQGLVNGCKTRVSFQVLGADARKTFLEDVSIKL